MLIPAAVAFCVSWANCWGVMLEKTRGSAEGMDSNSPAVGSKGNGSRKVGLKLETNMVAAHGTG